MRIGIDIDGVMADFNKSYIELVKEISGEDKFGPNYVPTTWNYPESVGYSAEVVSSAWEHIKQSSDFWLNLDELEGFDHVKDWFTMDRQIKHEVYFITSRMGQLVKLQSETWLGVHGGFYPTVLISSEKGLCCKALKLEYYLDDKIENIESVSVESPSTLAYILTQPWNKSAELSLRVNSVKEFLKYVS